MLHKLYKKQVEAWKDRFDGHFAYIANALDFYTTEHYTEVRKKGFEHLDDIKSFISSSRHKDTIELIEAEIERKRGMRREMYDLEGNKNPFREVRALQNEWYNKVIDEDIAYLEENLQKIKNEL